VFWVISVYFNIKNTLPKSGPFLLLHPVYILTVRFSILCVYEKDAFVGERNLDGSPYLQASLPDLD
jgi:hypothetical protein